MATKPKTIDDYLAGVAPEKRVALQKVRRAIHAAAPGAEECISYGMPAFRLNGKLIAGFKAAANHCAFYPMSGDTVATLEADLAGYDTSRGTIRFPARAGLPATLVRKLVKTRIAEARIADQGRGEVIVRAARRAVATMRPRIPAPSRSHVRARPS